MLIVPKRRDWTPGTEKTLTANLIFAPEEEKKKQKKQHTERCTNKNVETN